MGTYTIEMKESGHTQEGLLWQKWTAVENATGLCRLVEMPMDDC
jgi:hypothetical protein